MEPGEILAAVRGGGWDLLFVPVDGHADERAFDDQLAGLLEHLDEDAALLIVSEPGAFVLAGPGVPPLGEVTGARSIDLAPTLLAHAGLDVPETMPGRPLNGGHDDAPSPREGAAFEEDPDVLARLRGLGYL
jgi:hypothetical protein